MQLGRRNEGEDPVLEDGQGSNAVTGHRPHSKARCERSEGRGSYISSERLKFTLSSYFSLTPGITGATRQISHLTLDTSLPRDTGISQRG